MLSVGGRAETSPTTAPEVSMAIVSMEIFGDDCYQGKTGK